MISKKCWGNFDILVQIEIFKKFCRNFKFKPNRSGDGRSDRSNDSLGRVRPGDGGLRRIVGVPADLTAGLRHSELWVALPLSAREAVFWEQETKCQWNPSRVPLSVIWELLETNLTEINRSGGQIKQDVVQIDRLEVVEVDRTSLLPNRWRILVRLDRLALVLRPLFLEF